MIADLVDLAEGVAIRWRLRAARACLVVSDVAHTAATRLTYSIPGVTVALRRPWPADLVWPHDGDQPLPEWEAELLRHPWSPWPAGQFGPGSRRSYDLEL